MTKNLKKLIVIVLCVIMCSGCQSMEKDPDNGGIKSIIQDIFWYDAIAESGTATLGEETMENLFDKSNQAKTEKNKEINEKKDGFLQYIYEEWKKKEN